jgi:hypothetical protein
VCSDSEFGIQNSGVAGVQELENPGARSKADAEIIWGAAKVPNNHRLAMTRNVEIKARVRDLAALRKRVVEVSASGPELLVQRDTFYTVLQGRLKLREFGDGTAELIYYERPDKAGPKTSKYTRTQISDAASMRETKSLGKSLAKFWRKFAGSSMLPACFPAAAFRTKSERLFDGCLF